MKNETAHETLTRFNEWRRGAEIEQPDPTQIGLAIDAAIKALKNNNFEKYGKPVYLPNKSLAMNIKIKKGVDPIGTYFKISNDLFGQSPTSSTTYEVYAVSGNQSHVPQDGIVDIYLKAVQRRVHGVPFYTCILLSEMPKATVPVSDEDVFWEFKGKKDVSNAKQVSFPDNE